MHFSTSTSLLLLSSLAQAQAQVHRVVGPNDSANEPLIVKQDNTASIAADEGEVIVNGILTSFSVLEGTGCPAGTFTPQPIEAGKSTQAVIDFSNFVFNSTTSEGPATCSLKYDFEFTYPASDAGIPILYPQVATETSSSYEEGDSERSTNFNLVHVFNVKAGEDGLYNVSITQPLQFHCFKLTNEISPALFTRRRVTDHS